MRTFIFAWNPTRWSWDQFDKVVSTTQGGKIVSGSWSTGVNKSILPNERFFLLRQAHERGIIGSGHTTSRVYQDAHWDGSRREANYVKVNFDRILGVRDVLPVEILQHAKLGINWNAVQASGIALPQVGQDKLERLWRTHLANLGKNVAPLPEEVKDSGRYVEGAKRRIVVNAYERSPMARQKCIAHYGLSCAACGFNFGLKYGSLGSGYIHIHHVRDLSGIGKEYEVDPIRDLRPVCPNCHAMLHQQEPAISISRLRAVLARVQS